MAMSPRTTARLSLLLVFSFTLMGFGPVLLQAQQASKTPAPPELTKGTATSSEECGACHQAIYREFQYGFGGDVHFSGMVTGSSTEPRLNMPAGVSAGASAHAAAGVDPYPIHARDIEEEGRSCNVCHFTKSFAIPPIDSPEIVKPTARPKEEEAVGLTCASCHLTPEGKIRTPHEVKAPHETVLEPAIQSSAMCAYCHSVGKRLVGRQTQTFLEWREDFYKAGLGKQPCQDCHMPRTTRKVAEDFDVPLRPVARHLWTGGHSSQRLGMALSLTLVQPEANASKVEFHIINIGAGHSVPTGSNRRGIYLRAEAVDEGGKVLSNREWLFAPFYGKRPDDRSFLEEDKKLPDAVSAIQADAQGPHELSIRAGEERILAWTPELKAGTYTVRATLVYDLNRYNDPKFVDDETTLTRTSLDFKVGAGK
jgi:nitrate/TMAO reductase-like tetraheme cytochrome c subunit